jgi:rhodanese-related sulfurtransferase
MILSLFLLFAAPTSAAPPTTPPDKVRLLQLNHTPDLLIIDVRDPNEFAQSHIQGAKNVPAPGIQLAQLPHDARIIVYCGEASCPLSSGAAQKLISDGYSHVSLLDGGLAAWYQKGYPIQTSAPKNEAKHKSSSIPTKEARRLLDTNQALAIDTRPALEYAAGHIPQARNVPLETLDTNIALLPKDKEILIYDRLESRSKLAVQKLTTAGLKASELSGGIAGWLSKGGSLEVKKQ